ncbi:MAG: nickel-dependent lactate racemase [Candidatus Eremiobacteraeota bacterium]|nr:nickel-dependent lactate racemase [Candidatus Eremiobacteraeota bacterium]
MKIRVTYGRDGLDVDVPDGARIIEPLESTPLRDELGAFREAVRAPRSAPALRELVGSHERVVIVTSDVTRATPNERLIPWILDELGHVPAEQITVIVGTGSHRATTGAEMEAMFGRATLERVRVVDHDAHDPTQVVRLGTTSLGADVFLNGDYVRADKRICVGFIEPHLYAGFSGGPKGIMPGVAGIDTVKFFHNAKMVGDPNSRWLNLENNPIQAMAREVAAMAPPHFLVNVTLDGRKNITGFFCGHYLTAHQAGMDFCKRQSATPVPHRYDVVLSTNGGYPLDQNLYQCGKGLSAAMQIVKPGGTIVMCAELSDGLPDHGNFKDILRARETPEALLAMIEGPDYSVYDQWAAQSQAMILLHAKVELYSTLPDEVVESAMLVPTHDPTRALREALAAAGPHATCAVLPHGPYVVPYIETEPVTAV